MTLQLLPNRDAIRFVVHGRPQQKGSKTSRWAHRPGGGINVWQQDVNPNAKPWQATVSAAAADAIAPGPLLRGPVAVELVFCFKRPKGHYGTGRNAGAVRASAPQWMTTMPDIDKLARTALDGLTGALIGDDAQVCHLELSKCYGEPERLEVIVLTLDGGA